MSERPAFVHRTRIAFHQADPAGVLFFGRYAELWQAAYEGFIESCGIGYDAWFGQATHSTPIRRVEVDHLRPIFAGEPVEVRVTVVRVGATSFTLAMTAVGVGRADAGADDARANDARANDPRATDVRAEATIMFVYTEAAADGGFAPTRLPAHVRAMLEAQAER